MPTINDLKPELRLSRKDEQMLFRAHNTNTDGRAYIARSEVGEIDVKYAQQCLLRLATDRLTMPELERLCALYRRFILLTNTKRPPGVGADIDHALSECVDYSYRYKCSLRDAIQDWEGEDENGGFGLTDRQVSLITILLVEYGHDLDLIPTNGVDNDQ